MKKVALVFLLVFALGISTAYAKVLTFNKRYEGSRVTIKLYNGQLLTQSAKIVVITDGGGTHSFSIDVEAEGPSGRYKKREIGWGRPDERHMYEMPLSFVVRQREEPGTGHVRILCGGDEILYVEFAYDGRNIRFGESYKPSPNVDVDVEQKVEINMPDKTPQGAEMEEPEIGPTYERPPGEKKYRHSAFFHVKSIPSSAEVYIGDWHIDNTPTWIELPLGQKTITIKKKGYVPWSKNLNVSSEGFFVLHVRLIHHERREQ